MHDDNDDDKNCHQYLHKILDIFHITITNSLGRVLDLVKLNPWWELARRCYQLPQVSMENIVENWVDCQMEAFFMPRISNNVVWGKNPAKLTEVCLRSFTNQVKKNKNRSKVVIKQAYNFFVWRN